MVSDGGTVSTETCKARLEMAVPGPWSLERGHEGWDIYAGDRMVTDDGGTRCQDAILIAHAPTDLAAALKVIEAIKACNEAAVVEALVEWEALS